MNIAKNFWVSANKSSNLSFDTLCKLTLEVCELSEFPCGTFTFEGNRWGELAKAWDKLLDGGSFGIFLDVVHRAMWGFPYCWGNPKYEEIIRIVQYEMALEREAFIAWDTYSEFEDAICVPTNEGIPWLDDTPAYHCSVHHYEYLTTRMLYKLRFSKRKYRKGRKACREVWGEYHQCIGKILPASRKWDEVQWLNEDNIHNEILHLHGVDYRNDMESYVRLYEMLTIRGGNRRSRLVIESWFASQVRELPISLVKVIWPKDTAGVVIQMFAIAANQAEENRKETGLIKDDGDSVGVFTYRSLRDSWMYRLVNGWISGCKLESASVKEMKRLIFNVAMYT